MSYKDLVKQMTVKCEENRQRKLKERWMADALKGYPCCAPCSEKMPAVTEEGRCTTCNSQIETI